MVWKINNNAYKSKCVKSINLEKQNNEKKILHNASRNCLKFLCSACTNDNAKLFRPVQPFSYQRHPLAEEKE